ncbi:MAG: NVEALA domain-containing protein [Bacteroidales bacterium]|jgi:CDP-diacylglycerol pyrophosphatase|nr:NVEALA domain-containing protein [Bacteroidales bacterium]
MKKKVFCGIAACMMIAAVAAWNVYVSQSKNEMALSNVVLENIEALATENDRPCSFCHFTSFDLCWFDSSVGDGCFGTKMILIQA